MTSHNTSAGQSLAETIVDRVESLVVEAEVTDKPLEVDPLRDQLFELFVTAQGAGFVEENAEFDLTAEGLCHSLADRWGLAEAARDSHANQNRLDGEHLARMRLLWSVMRMWMEWGYAWERWPEFHLDEAGD